MRKPGRLSRRALIGGALAGSGFGLPLILPARAQTPVAAVELVLAVDVSGSVDAFESRQQRQGYIQAITDPRVLRAIAGTEQGAISVTYVEYADPGFERVLVDWVLIDGPAAAEDFAGRLASAPTLRAMYTSIASAIELAMRRFAANPWPGARKVIDISGDGPNNAGRPLMMAREAALAQGVTINGLPILNDRPQPFAMPTPMDVDLDLYYADNVIGGPGHFMIIADGFDDFARAILSKLIREIA